MALAEQPIQNTMTEWMGYLDNRRRCANCSSLTTWISRRGHPNWHRLKGKKDVWLCHNCNARLNIHPTYGPRRIRIFDKQIYLDERPRIGQCSQCYRLVGIDIARTNLCFDPAIVGPFDPDDPLKNAVELCIRCHMRLHAAVKRHVEEYYDPAA